MRLMLLYLSSNRISFNPRICKRCDTALFGTIDRIGVSIHASVKDATFFQNGRSLNTFVSIHASVKDATASSFYNIDSGLVSIHASVKDATPPIQSFKHTQMVSIHASVKDATGYQRPWYEYVQFQSTHL